MPHYDYIVAGAGSAGCVVTQRLVAAGKSVLLVEAGPADNTPFIHIPATFFRVFGTARTWLYQSEPEPGAKGRRMVVPQGRTLGGGSSVNGMIYIRGQPQDYDGWRDLGCEGWGWEDVLPVFRRSEANQRLAGPLHGTEGRLHVSDTPFRHPLSYAFVRAAQEVGLPFNHDFNGPAQEGVGFYQTTTHQARRGSTAATYLAAVRSSPLLTLRTEAAIEAVLLENGAAAGLRYRTKDGAAHEARMREELVLCAGAIATPKLLQLSGIGPGEHLAALGIPVTRDLPGVGANYQDHIAAPVYGQARAGGSLLGEDRGLRAARHGLQYLLTRTGLLASNVIESGAFADTAGSGRPDVQIHVAPTLTGDIGRAPPSGHGITISPCILRPASRGTVRLRGRDPAAPAALLTNSLATPEDMATLLRGVRLARRILRAPSLARLMEREIAPAEAEEVDDAVLEEHVRGLAKTVYHPAGTCRMGVDTMAVTDPQLRVRGVPRLRVADASVMPTLISGNTNAPVVMIGERCADFLLRAG
ncbi:GMC family oxidoreductase [Roseomonas chloroacetimidivorans]|uniref:GMC family oxidoreductase n=1 Tax=Roseomonas chloroacetimidivorans TaxID=1766656 RepID=UPI003C744CE0